jgi:hypothetical protein
LQGVSSFISKKLNGLDENDLSAFGHIHEVAGGDHTVNAGEEVFLFDAERKSRRCFFGSRRHPQARASADESQWSLIKTKMFSLCLAPHGIKRTEE